MTSNLIKQITVLGQRSLIRKTILAKFYTGSLYEPNYLKVRRHKHGEVLTGKSKIPLLPVINVQIRGYDYSVLENYQAFMHKLADTMQIDVDDSWPLPHQEFKIQRYKTGTTAVVSDYTLKIYERHMQLSEVSSTKCSVLIRALEAALPQGITLNIDVYDPAMERNRYVPDKELMDLKSSLNEFKKK